MKALIAALAVVGIAAVVATAQAEGTRDPGVNARQHHQRDRIGQGARSGELTRDEAKGLRQEERAIRREEREYKSDGKLTRAERRDLHRDQNKVSRDIYKEKHDAEKR